MRILSTLFILLTCGSAFAQTGRSEFYNSFISLSGGRSTHGTGDMKGVSQKIAYGKYFKKRLLWFSSVGADIHDGKFEVTRIGENGETTDHSFRYTSGAFQLTGGVGFSFLRNSRSDLGIKIGGILRYQSSSFYDNLSILFDPERIGPYPATFIFNTSPQRTYSAGVGPEAFYQQTIFRSIFAGLSAGFQVDTNGDVLTNMALSIGKRIK